MSEACIMLDDPGRTVVETTTATPPRRTPRQETLPEEVSSDERRSLGTPQPVDGAWGYGLTSRHSRMSLNAPMAPIRNSRTRSPTDWRSAGPGALLAWWSRRRVSRDRSSRCSTAWPGRASAPGCRFSHSLARRRPGRAVRPGRGRASRGRAVAIRPARCPCP